MAGAWGKRPCASRSALGSPSLVNVDKRSRSSLWPRVEGPGAQQSACSAEGVPARPHTLHCCSGDCVSPNRRRMASLKTSSSRVWRLVGGEAPDPFMGHRPVGEVGDPVRVVGPAFAGRRLGLGGGVALVDEPGKGPLQFWRRDRARVLGVVGAVLADDTCAVGGRRCAPGVVSGPQSPSRMAAKRSRACAVASPTAASRPSAAEDEGVLSPSPRRRGDARRGWLSRRRWGCPRFA
jgi:hypothetical protein